MSHSPSLTALRTFDLVARLGTFTEAARKLNVTRPAVSKQIKNLETLMRCQLLIRSGSKVILTEQGNELAAGLRQGFDIISASTQSMLDNSNQPKVVRILVERDFASSWLAERIGAFLLAHPGTSIEINAERNGQLRKDENFSFRIFFGPEGRYETENFIEDFLCDWIDIPVCTPEYAATYITEHGRYHNAHFLLDKNYNPWSEWFEKVGLENPGEQATYTSFNETTLCLSAALAGSGITIGDSFLCLAAIDNGSLVAPLKIGLRSAERYSICYPKGRNLSKPERDFRKWLTRTIWEYEQNITQILSGINIEIV
jgi:DNA-binding transcriptional LysR family regulator